MKQQNFFIVPGRVIASIALLALFMMGQLSAADEVPSREGIYVTFDGEPGLSFSALSLKFGITSESMASEKAPASMGMVDFDKLEIEKSFGAESPQLFIGAAKGTIWQKVTINIVDFDYHGIDVKMLATVEMHNVQISLYNASSNMLSHISTAEQVGLIFSKICFTTYDPSEVTECWDMSKAR